MFRQPVNNSWWQREWPWLSYLLVFVIAFIVFMVFQASPYFADPDSFYHAKMAMLIRDQGIVHQFPWLQLTVLGQSYTDQHLLYHILLIPFVTWLPPLVGLKLATVFFGALLAVTMFWAMRRLNVRWPLLFVLVLIAIRPFTFRVALAKAPSTSLIFMLIGLVWIFQYQLKKLFALAMVYVWYYGGFPLLGVSAVIASGTSWLHNRLITKQNSHHFVQKVLSLVGPRSRRHQPRRLNGALLVVVGLGLLAGLVLNPYFPANLKFYEHQLVNIGIINFQKVIGVGNEWYPYQVLDLLANGAFASLLILIALIGAVIKFRAQSKQAWAMFLLTVFFFLLTLKSRRYVEYYIPIAVLFSAVSISDTIRGLGWSNLQHQFREWFFKRRAGVALGILFVVYLTLGTGYIAGRDFHNELADLHQGFKLDKFEAVSQWLIANTPDRSRIVHSDWDEFPVLFYHNTHNTYIVGLDPTFLYKADQAKYWTWVNLTLGKYEGDIYDAVTNKLGSQYVLVANNHDAMDRQFRNNLKFKKLYRDAEATVYGTNQQ